MTGVSRAKCAALRATRPNQAEKIASTIRYVGEFAATKPQQTVGRRVTKALPYVAALVFVAGGIAFLIAYFGNTSNVTHPGTRPGTPALARCWHC